MGYCYPEYQVAVGLANQVTYAFPSGNIIS